ncbi:hypothetical protein D1007_02204 [Hordeum vulgare]|nr:hypothetical protein D1007_02204 [Hordeum vulgare]
MQMVAPIVNAREGDRFLPINIELLPHAPLVPKQEGGGSRGGQEQEEEQGGGGSSQRAPLGAPKDTEQVNIIKKMDKIVNIHYVDKEALMNVAIVDKYEEVLTFLDSSTYEEVVAETRIRLKWVDPSDQVELLGRYDVGSAHKCRMKTMPIKSNLHWVAYKEAVASSIEKSLEVFASTVVNAPLHVDLNQPIVDDLSPYNVVAPIVDHKVEVQVNEYPQYEFGGSAPIKDDGHESDEEYERQHNIVGDVEAQVRHDDMDPDIVYQRACVDESDDEGPENELDEDGFTEKEAEWYTKITGRDHKVPLFCDVSLADKALVDGGMSKTIEARMFPSSTPNAISTSYLKKGLMFEDILELKMWLCEYAVKHYRPFRVAYSDCHKRYTAKCEVEKCKWKVNSRLMKDEIGKLIGENEKPSNEIYPKKVAEWLEFQKEKSAMQRATCFDNAEMKYQVDEPGGTTRDGQSYGGRSFIVSLRTRHCTCERPSKYHWTCSHMMTACRMRNLPFSHGVVVRLHEFNLQTHQLTWASRFHPFLDPSQWPEYHSPNIRPDPEMMVQPKGRRRTKRYRNEMDDLMSTREFGSGHFMEPRDRQQCGDCNETTHNRRTCKTNNASTSDVGDRGGSSAGGGRRGGSSGGIAMGRGSGGGRRGGSSGGLPVGRGSGGGRRGGLSMGRGSGGGRRGSLSMG